MSDDPGPHANPKPLAHAFIVLGLVLVTLGLFVLNAVGKLPPLIGTIGTGISGLTSFFAVFWEHIHDHLNQLRRHPSRKVRIGAILTCFIIVILMVVGALFLPNSTNVIPASGGSGLSYSNARAPTATPTPSPTLASSIPRGSTFRQLAPSCDNPSGTLWRTPQQETSLTCTPKGVEIKQTQPTSNNSLGAQVELDQINGLPYSLIDFSVMVQITFPKPHDTEAQAGLILDFHNEAGGNRSISLDLTANGQWQLNGLWPGVVTINPSQATLMDIALQHGELDCYINSQRVISYGFPDNETLNSISLSAYQINSASPSPIRYSNFELDVQ